MKNKPNNTADAGEAPTQTQIPLEVAAFLELRRQTPVPSLTPEEDKALAALELEIKRTGEQASMYHPTNRNATRKRLKQKIVDATTPEAAQAAASELAGFESGTEQIHQNAKRVVIRLSDDAARILCTAAAREIGRLREYETKLRSCELRNIDLDCGPLLARVSSVREALEANLDRVALARQNGGSGASLFASVAADLRPILGRAA